MTDYKAEFKDRYPALFNVLKNVEIIEKMRLFYREIVPDPPSIVFDCGEEVSYDFWRYLLVEREGLPHEVFAGSPFEDFSLLETTPFLRLFLAYANSEIHQALFDINHIDFMYYPSPKPELAKKWLHSPFLGSNTVETVLKCKTLTFVKTIQPLSVLVSAGKISVVKTLINDPRVWINIDKSELLLYAIRSKKLGIIKDILARAISKFPNRMSTRTFNPTVMSTRTFNPPTPSPWDILHLGRRCKALNSLRSSTSLFEEAVTTGDLGIVKTLLEDGRVDPTAYEGAAVNLAYESSHMKILYALLDDPRMEAKVLKDLAGQLINRLHATLDWDRSMYGTNVSAANNLILVWAIINGDTDKLRNVLAHPTFKIEESPEKQLITELVSTNHISSSVVEILDRDVRFEFLDSVPSPIMNKCELGDAGLLATLWMKTI